MLTLCPLPLNLNYRSSRDRVTPPTTMIDAWVAQIGEQTPSLLFEYRRLKLISLGIPFLRQLHVSTIHHNSISVRMFDCLVWSFIPSTTAFWLLIVPSLDGLAFLQLTSDDSLKIRSDHGRTEPRIPQRPSPLGRLVCHQLVSQVHATLTTPSLLYSEAVF